MDHASEHSHAGASSVCSVTVGSSVDTMVTPRAVLSELVLAF